MIKVLYRRKNFCSSIDVRIISNNDHVEVLSDGDGAERGGARRGRM
jgi:hypothetical protein